MKRLFYFRPSDRKAMMVLVAVAAVCAMVCWYLSGGEAGQAPYANRYNRPAGQGKTQYYAQPDEAQGKARLFPFDPNTADSTQLLALGLQPWQVRSIYKYRAHGGHFRKKEDFARLYGLTYEHYCRLAPYIRIKEVRMAADVVKEQEEAVAYGDKRLAQRTRNEANDQQLGNEGFRQYARNQQWPKKLKPGETVDVNTADTNELKRVPGIGSYFAHRIVELRSRRQMFVSPEELLEIRKFPETALAYMTASQNFPRINVNTATQQQLTHHPLINYTQARDIISYRRTNGDLHSAADLRFFSSFDDEQRKRLAPFLVFN